MVCPTIPIKLCVNQLVRSSAFETRRAEKFTVPLHYYCLRILNIAIYRVHGG